MATYQAVFVPTSPTASSLFNGTIATGANTTITLSNRVIFAVAVSGDCAIRFGNATKVPTATAADWPVFGRSTVEFETGEEFDRFNLFNNTGATITYWVYTLSRS